VPIQKLKAVPISIDLAYEKTREKVARFVPDRAKEFPRSSVSSWLSGCWHQIEWWREI